MLDDPKQPEEESHKETPEVEAEEAKTEETNEDEQASRTVQSHNEYDPA